MHVLVCICSNVRQFSQLMQKKKTQLSPCGSIVLVWPCFVGHNSWPTFRGIIHLATIRPLLKAGTQWARHRQVGRKGLRVGGGGGGRSCRRSPQGPVPAGSQDRVPTLDVST